MKTTLSLTQRSNTKSPALDKLLKDAQDYCDTAISGTDVIHTIEQISQNMEQLSEEHRSALQSIGELMTACNAPPIRGMTRPGTFELTLSQDQMHLLMRVTPPIAGGQPVAAPTVIQAIRDRGIQQGVMLPQIQAALQSARLGNLQQDIVVVHGKDPVRGQDACLECFARTALHQPLERIHLDTLALGPSLSLLCEKDDVVLIYHSPIPGQAGYDATGRSIAPPDVNDITIHPGENIIHQGQRFIAGITGMLQFVNHTLHIMPVLMFPRDVTSQASPIDFQGQVIVQGSVRSGVKLKATKNITVKGDVEAAMLCSIQGSIIIEQGVVGRGQAILRAAGNISARFAENASLRADQDIIIENGAMRCSLVAGHAILIAKGKGQLVGGSALAGQSITVSRLGSPSGLPTEVSVGLSKRAMKLMARIDQIRCGVLNSLETSSELIKRFDLIVRDPKKMDKKSLTILTKLRQMHLVLEVQLKKFAQRRKRVMNIANQDHPGVVDVIQEVLAGVSIRIGNAVYENKNLLKHRRFTYDPKSKMIVNQPLQ